MKKLKNIINEGQLPLQFGKLNEVKPFVDPKLKSKPNDQVQYIATNDHRYPSEIAFLDTKKNEVVFFNIQQKEVERVSMERLSSTHWVRDYMPSADTKGFSRDTPSPGDGYKLGGRTWEGKVNEVETEDDTEFKVSLKHLLKKHVTKGGEIEEATDTHIPQIADDKKYVAEFRKKYGAQETNKFLSFEIEPLAGSGHFNYRDIAKLAKKNKFGIWDTVRLVNKAYVNQVKGVPMNVKNESVDEAMDINDPILVSIRARQTMLKKMKSAPKVKKISIKQYLKLMDVESDIIDQMKDATKEYEQLDSDMNAEAGQKGADWSDADANRYGGDLDKLQTKIEKLAKQKQTVKKSIMNYRIS